jgi:hypothetical protein
MEMARIPESICFVIRLNQHLNTLPSRQAVFVFSTSLILKVFFMAGNYYTGDFHFAGSMNKKYTHRRKRKRAVPRSPVISGGPKPARKSVPGLVLVSAMPVRYADAKRWNEAVRAWPK